MALGYKPYNDESCQIIQPKNNNKSKPQLLVILLLASVCTVAKDKDIKSGL